MYYCYSCSLNGTFADGYNEVHKSSFRDYINGTEVGRSSWKIALDTPSDLLIISDVSNNVFGVIHGSNNY